MQFVLVSDLILYLKMVSRVIVCLLSLGLFSACKSAEDYLSEGQDLSSEGNFKAALLTFDKAIEKNPFLKDAYIQMGTCYDYLNQYDSAIRVYRKLLHIYPDNTAAYYYSGICRFKQEKYDDAIAFYNKAIETKGGLDVADTTSIQAMIDLNKDNFESESAEIDIPSREIVYDRGMAYYRTGQMKNARYDFENCITQNYNPGTSYYMIGLCRLAKKDMKYAREAFFQASNYGDSLAIKQLRSSENKNAESPALIHKKA